MNTSIIKIFADAPSAYRRRADIKPQFLKQRKQSARAASFAGL